MSVEKAKELLEKIIKIRRFGGEGITKQELEMGNLAVLALAELDDNCPKCGGKREKHCSLNYCVKTHDGITCFPNGVKCEYYIGKGEKE